MYLRIYRGVVHDFSMISCVFSCDLVIYRMIGANILIFAHIISILSGLCAVYSVLVHHLFLSYCVIFGFVDCYFKISPHYECSYEWKFIDNEIRIKL